MRKVLFIALLLPSASVAFTNYELNPGVFELRLNRHDLSVERLWIQPQCFSLDGTSSGHDCIDVTVDGKVSDGLIELLAEKGEKNRIHTPKISIQYREETQKIFCVGMKVVFGGFPNQCDSVLYSERLDRYSILSFCNVDVLPDEIAANPRHAHRRAHSWSQFAARFSQPVTIQLTDAKVPDWCKR